LIHGYLPKFAALPEGIRFIKPEGYLLLLFGLILWGTAVIQLLMGFSKGKLVTTGAYGVVRNPIYSSVTFFILPAIALLTLTWVYFVVSVFLYVGVTIFIVKEEKQLMKAFRKKYEDYIKKAKVRNTDEINLGDMIDWSNAKWLVTSIDPDTKTYKRAELKLCTFLLKWQNKKGDVVERWCVDKNATSNLDENKVITTSNSEFDLQLTLDDESKLLELDKRFLHDVDGVDIPSAYKLIDRNVVSGNYQYFNRGGILNITIKQDQFNKDIDNKTLMIADYFSPTPSLQDESGILSYSKLKCSSPSNQISVGSYRYITATMYDSKDVINTIITPVFTYEFPTGFEDQFTVSVIDRNKIKLSVKDNNALLSKSVKVGVSDGQGGFVSEITLTIIAGI
jgi:hypothetical protein